MLEIANREYEAGRLQSCLDMRNPFINSVASDEVYVAYPLISLGNLFQNKSEPAENAAVKLLKRKPDYREFPLLDPVEFTKLLSCYDVWSKLESGLSVSLNVNSIHLLKSYNVINTEGEYKPKTGFRAGVLGEYFLNKRDSLNGALAYESLNYSSYAANVGVNEQTYSENLRYFTVPLSYRYYLKDYKRMR